MIGAACLGALTARQATAQPPSLQRVFTTGNLLPFFIGRWHFQLAVRSGTREYRWLYRDHTIVYVEKYHGREVEGRGVYHYSPPSTYINTTFFNTGEASIMEGSLDLDTCEIRFTPMRGAIANNIRAHLKLESDSAFSYHLFERNAQSEWVQRWTAAFQRD